MLLLENVLLILILVSAASILFCKRIQTVVGVYMLFSLLLAVLWGLQYGMKLALAEIAVGVIVVGILFYFAARKLRRQKGPQDE